MFLRNVGIHQKTKEYQNPKHPMTWEPENLYFNLLVVLVYFLILPKIGHTSTALLNFMLCWNKYFQFWMFSRRQYPQTLTACEPIQTQSGAEPNYTFQKALLLYKRGRGQSLYTEKEWCHAVAKPVQWEWIRAVCSVLMSDDSICAYQVSHGCGFAGPNGLGFLPVGYLKELLCRNRSHKCRSWYMIFGVKLLLWIKSWRAEFFRVLWIVLR
jgi:hypothetical protein